MRRGEEGGRGRWGERREEEMGSRRGSEEEKTRDVEALGVAESSTNSMVLEI